MVVLTTDNTDYQNWDLNQGKKEKDTMPQKQGKSKSVRSKAGKNTTATTEIPEKKQQNKKWNKPTTSTEDTNHLPLDSQNSKDTSNKKKKTPYQGPYRTCGMFHCQKCKKEWFSANSWANCYQKCNGCNKKVYPYKQFRPLGGVGPRVDAPPHPLALCQKCEQLGHSCVKKYVDTVEREDESSDAESLSFTREE